MSKKRPLNLKFLFVLLACCIAAVVFVQYYLLGSQVVTYKDEIITCGTVRRPLDALVVHASHVNYICVGGRTYRHVRGLQPFYLRLPSLQSILFVTEAGRDEAEFHIVRIGDWAETVIRGEKISFGGHIGDTDSPGNPYTDYVERESSSEIVLATRYPNARLLVFLDLVAKKVAKLEYDEFDGVHVKAHHVYINGKQME